MPKGPDYFKEEIDFHLILGEINIPEGTSPVTDRQLRESIENVRHSKRMAELQGLIDAEKARHTQALAKITGVATPTIPEPTLREILAQPQVPQKVDPFRGPFIGDDRVEYWSLKEVMAANRERQRNILPKMSSSIENIKFIKNY